MEEEITRLFKVRRTVLQMLRDRGYNVEESDLNMKREEFIQKFCKAPLNKVNKEALFFEANKGPNSADKVTSSYQEHVIKSCNLLIKSLSFVTDLRFLPGRS